MPTNRMFLLLIGFLAFLPTAGVLTGCDPTSSDKDEDTSATNGVKTDTLVVLTSDTVHLATGADNPADYDSIAFRWNDSLLSMQAPGTYVFNAPCTPREYLVSVTGYAAEGSTLLARWTVRAVDSLVLRQNITTATRFMNPCVEYRIPAGLSIQAEAHFGPRTRIRVDKNLLVQAGGLLRADEGATFRMAPGVVIDVQQGSVLSEGSDSLPVSFKSQGTGHWGYMYTSTNQVTASDNSYAMRLQAGSSVQSAFTHTHFDSASTGALVLVDNLSFLNCTFSHHKHHGIHFKGVGPKDSVGFMGNRFFANGTGATGFPLAIQATMLGRLSGSSVFEENLNQAILVYGNSQIANDAVWKAQTVPYAARDNVILAAGNLTIRPGTEIRFFGGAALDVKSGALLSLGTESKPVVFNSFEPGKFWGYKYTSSNATNEADNSYGIRFGSGASAGSRLEYTIIDSATVGLQAMGPDFAINGCTFRNSQYHGLHFTTGGPSEFGSNTFVNNGTTNVSYPLHISSSDLHKLNGQGSFTGNQHQAIGVFRRSDVSNNGTWSRHEVPYAFLEAVSLKSAAGLAITVQPGAELRFVQGVGITVSDGATFTADGEADKVIGFGNYVSGSRWGYHYNSSTADTKAENSYGIRIEDGANPNSSFTYCRFEEATTALNFRGGATLASCSFVNSQYYDVFVTKAAAALVQINQASLTSSGSGVGTVVIDN